MSHIGVERAGPVTTLRLGRGALDHALVRDLYAAFGALHADPSQQVVVLTGVGRTFCSGIDREEQVAGLFGALRRIPQPVIAVVGGVAAGGGLSLACAADLRVAEPDAAFSASGCSTSFLSRVIGWERAVEMLAGGRTLDASEAERIGLVGRVVPAGEGLAAAQSLARAIATAAPVSARATKSLLDLTVDGAALPGLDGYPQVARRPASRCPVGSPRSPPRCPQGARSTSAPWTGRRTR